MIIPSHIFKDRRLAVLEAVVAHLKEKEKLSYTEIAKLLNRDDRTVWTTYKRTIEKRRK